VSKFNGGVALAAEREAVDADEGAEGIFVFFGESESITEDDEDAVEANGEDEWVAPLHRTPYPPQLKHYARPTVRPRTPTASSSLLLLQPPITVPHGMTMTNPPQLAIVYPRQLTRRILNCTIEHLNSLFTHWSGFLQHEFFHVA
jgi:hypothetical protein